MSYVWSESLQQASDMARSWNTDEFKSCSKDTRTLSLNILAATGFKKPFAFRPAGEDAVEDSKLSYRDSLQVILDNIIPLPILRPRFLTYPVLPKSLQRVGRAATAFKKYMVQMLDEEMASLKQENSGSGSLMTSLVRAGDSYSKHSEGSEAKMTGLSVDEIFGNIFVINFAGHDTTANTLAFSILMLAAYPDIQGWLAEEVQDATKGANVEKWEYSALFPKLVRCRALMVSIPPSKVSSSNMFSMRFSASSLQSRSSKKEHRMFLSPSMSKAAPFRFRQMLRSWVTFLPSISMLSTITTRLCSIPIAGSRMLQATAKKPS
jgi:hypothetical protein